MPTKDFSCKHEKEVAKYLGWKVVSGSGARPFNPGDVVGDRFLGECKTHVQELEHITFHIDDWKKIQKEALSQFKVPVLFVDDGTQFIKRTWVVVPSAVMDFEKNLSCSYTSAPVKLRSNMIFNGYELSKFLKDSGLKYVSFYWDTGTCLLMSIESFYDLIND